jgi:SNF2 family DNA or RNA helicase
MKPRAMAKATRDYILRRTKDMVLTDMPPKLFRDAELELSPEQWETYQTAENDGVLRLEDMGEGITIQHVFELVLRLKQICNFDPATGASCKLERLEADLEEVAASGQRRSSSASGCTAGKTARQPATVRHAGIPRQDPVQAA